MIERTIILDNVDPVVFYGVNNSNMHLIRSLYAKLRIAARGQVIKVMGEDSETVDFEKKIKELAEYANQYNRLAEDAILDIVKGEAPAELKRDDVIIYGLNGKPIMGRTPNQQKLVQEYTDNDLTFAMGPAGTGKTYIAIALVGVVLRARGAEAVPRLVLDALVGVDLCGVAHGEVGRILDALELRVIASVIVALGGEVLRVGDLKRIAPLHVGESSVAIRVARSQSHRSAQSESRHGKVLKNKFHQISNL